MRRIGCRGLRLEWVAGLGMALAMLVLPGSAAMAQSARTETTLAVHPGRAAGQAQATVTVTEDNGAPASGIVAIEEGRRQLAGVALNASGQANATLDLPAGTHTLQAVFQGGAAQQSSVSRPQAATTSATSTAPDFQVTVTPLQPSSTLTAGSAGNSIVTVTPINNAALTSPMFITLSCSGLPDQSSCTFTPATLEIVGTTPASCAAGSPVTACPPTASMVLQTQAPGTAGHTSMLGPVQSGHTPSGMTWAFLFPGALGLGGLAWGTRRRRWLSRVLVLAAVGVVTVMGTTACNPQYHYYNNGIPRNQPTPAGNYTVTVTAQSSNGITAITHSTTLAMTVK